MPPSEHDEERQPGAEVEGHLFAGFDDLFAADAEPVAAERVDEEGDAPDVQPHGMSNF